MPLKDLPPDARPREKMLARGPGALSDVELLALLLRTGIKGKGVFQLARELLDIKPGADGQPEDIAGFETEKPKLLSLPASAFELSEWRKSSVHPDCHIQVVKNFYSVPFTFVGKTVRVRLTAKLVEIFDDDGNIITAHERLHAEHRYSTDHRHYPEAKAAYAFFDVHQAKLQAARIGPHTEALVNKLLSGTHPLKYLRRVQGILRLAKHKRVKIDSIEYATKIALATNNLRLDFIQSAANHHDRFGPRPINSTAQKAPKREPDSLFLHDNSNQQNERTNS